MQIKETGMKLELDLRWQIEAYRKVIEDLNKKNKACVIAPPGCGKSPIGFQLLEDNLNEEALWLTSTPVAITEVKKLVKEIYGKDIKEVFPNLKILTYNELSRKNEGELKQFNPKIIIYDELHRAGAKIWGINAGILAGREGVKILGITATPVRTDERNMAEEICEGVSYELTWIEAIAREILPIPLYISVNYIFDTDIEKLEKKVERLENGEERERFTSKIKRIKEIKKRLGDAGNIQQILEKYIKDGKHIAFCKGFEHIDEMRELFETMDSNPNVVEISSRVSAKGNKANLDLLKEKDSKGTTIVLAVNKLNESFHDNELSGIINLRPTRSYIIFIQQLGRILSQGMKKVPLVLDLVGNLKYFKEFMAQIKRIIETGIEAGDNDKYNKKTLEKFKIIEEEIEFVKEFYELEKRLKEYFYSTLTMEELLEKAEILTEKEGVNFKKVNIYKKSNDSKQGFCTLGELNIKNIKEIIQKYNWDEDCEFGRRLVALRAEMSIHNKSKRNLKLEPEQIQRILAIPGFIPKEMLTKETKGQKLIRYCTTLEKNGVGLKELKLYRRKENGGKSPRSLEELDIANIEEIIQENELDRDYVLQYEIKQFLKQSRKGIAEKEYIQKLLEWRLDNETNVSTNREKRRYCRQINKTL